VPGAPYPPDRKSLIERILRIIAAHPNIAEVSPARPDPETGAWEIDAALRLGLPNAWIADGESPNGVRAVETVTIRFPAEFPLRAPIIHLRQEFDRSLAHVLPGGPATRPRPCLFDGDVSELLQQQGMAAILNQLVQWLEKAALGQLIDPAQGWEPVRRDELADFIVADAGTLRALISRKAGYAVFGFDYVLLTDPDGVPALHGEMSTDRIALSPKKIGAVFSETPVKASDRFRFGRSVAIVAWAGRDPSGQPMVANRYEPETVMDVGSLMARATEYSCAAPLSSAFRWLETCLAGYQIDGTVPIVVILCARRPFHLIGSNSSIELCPYVVEVTALKLLPAGDQTSVRPSGHRQAITTGLLRRMSGDDSAQESTRWVQLGCGSLGSKIALHLARAGRAPSIVIDRSHLSPHNAARHALVPTPGRMQIPWISDKAGALAEAIEGLGQRAEAVVGDLPSITRDKMKARKALPKRAWAIVNATASLAAREALGSIPRGIEIPRVIETSLFAAGNLGVVTVEGPHRNPDSLDLMAETYALAREEEALRALMFAEGAGLTRQSIGEGCGSATMALSDARVSTLAAPMAEIIAGMQRGSLPDGGGRILIGVVENDGISITWSDHEVAPAAIVPVEGPDGWRLHLSARAASMIDDDVKRWAQVETGGILMGRMSEAARTFYVTDLLPAPEDSERSAGEFRLGTRGARQVISDYAESCGYSLFCLGTWHSHLMPSGPSANDHATAATVALARLAPSVLLIHTPAGFTALLADTAAVLPFARRVEQYDP
jgi:hypothetical protein